MGIGPAYGTPGGGAGLVDGDKGDVTVSSDGESWTLDHHTVTNAHLSDMVGPSLKGRQSGTGEPADLTAAQATALLDAYTTSLNGLVPAPGTAAGKFLKDDGTWADLPDVADNAVTNAKLADMATATFKGRTTAGTGDPEDLTAAQATALLNPFTSSDKGVAPASGGGTTNFLRADGTWAAPSGSSGIPTNTAVYAVFATAAANTNVLSGSAISKLIFGTEVLDPAGVFNSALGRYQPTQAGYYRIAAQVFGSSTAGQLRLRITKNGSTEFVAQIGVNASFPAAEVDRIIFLNGTTDYVEIMCNAGASYTIPASVDTFIQCQLVYT